MKPLLAALSVLLTFCVIPISATVSCFDPIYGRWTCSYRCCFSFFGCCRSLGSVYWYAWVIVIIVIIFCVCICAGGGYGYRRYYYVRRVDYPPPTTTVVTAGDSSLPQAGYQPPISTSDKYQPYNAPPPYSATVDYKAEPAAVDDNL